LSFKVVQMKKGVNMTPFFILLYAGNDSHFYSRNNQYIHHFSLSGRNNGPQKKLQLK